jgi:hypothetical protein
LPDVGWADEGDARAVGGEAGVARGGRGGGGFPALLEHAVEVEVLRHRGVPRDVLELGGTGHVDRRAVPREDGVLAAREFHGRAFRELGAEDLGGAVR